MSNTITEVTKHLTIHGSVQGVAYRAWLIQKAEAAGVHGWVKNRHNGTVEALLHGPEAAVDQLIERAYKGPDAATVSKIDVNDSDYSGPALFEMHTTD